MLRPDYSGQFKRDMMEKGSVPLYSPLYYFIYLSLSPNVFFIRRLVGYGGIL